MSTIAVAVAESINKLYRFNQHFKQNYTATEVKRNLLYKMFISAIVSKEYVYIPLPIVLETLPNINNANEYDNVSEIVYNVGTIHGIDNIFGYKARGKVSFIAELLLVVSNNRENILHKIGCEKDNNTYIRCNGIILAEDFTPLFVPTLKIKIYKAGDFITPIIDGFTTFIHRSVYESDNYVENYITKKIVPYIIHNKFKLSPSIIAMYRMTGDCLYNSDVVICDDTNKFIRKGNSPEVLDNNIYNCILEENINIILENYRFKEFNDESLL